VSVRLRKNLRRTEKKGEQGKSSQKASSIKTKMPRQGKKFEERRLRGGSTGAQAKNCAPGKFFLIDRRKKAGGSGRKTLTRVPKKMLSKRELISPSLRKREPLTRRKKTPGFGTPNEEKDRHSEKGKKRDNIKGSGTRSKGASGGFRRSLKNKTRTSREKGRAGPGDASISTEKERPREGTTSAGERLKGGPTASPPEGRKSPGSMGDIGHHHTL